MSGGGRAGARVGGGGARPPEASEGASAVPVPVRPGLVWFGVVGGALAWAAHLGVSYSVVPFVCGTNAEWLLHLITLGAGGVAALAVAASWRSHRRLRGWLREREPRPAAAADELEMREREGVEGAEPHPGGGWRPAAEPGLGEVPAEDHARRHNFLAIFGILSSGFFLALILVEGLPALLSAPCAHLPTLDRLLILGPDAAEGRIAVGAAALPTAASPLSAALLPLPGLATLHDHPPGPGEVWAAWNWDLWVLGILLLTGTLYARGARTLWRRAGRGRGLPVWRAAAYFGGLAALFAALISPIDRLSEALFSVHMVQHLLLLVVAPPLLVLGRPDRAFFWGLPPGTRRRLGGWWRGAGGARDAWRTVTHPVTVVVLHVAALWLWHIPSLYEAALEQRWVHHLEHATFFFSAMLFWWVLASAGERRRWPGYGAGVLYVTATALQGGALGALLTFAPSPWYEAHAPGAAAWGVDLLVDQQLAGTLMWVPAGLIYGAAAVFLFLAWLRETERKVARSERFDPRRPAPARGDAT